MNLDFNNKNADYLSFNFSKGTNAKDLEAYLKLPTARDMNEVRSNIHEKTRIIIEKIAAIEDIKSTFAIDNILNVDFNNEQPHLVKYIIDDFIMKSKFKKYKNLLLWVPLLQDHFWMNEVKEIQDNFWMNEVKENRLEKKSGIRLGPRSLSPQEEYLGLKPSGRYKATLNALRQSIKTPATVRFKPQYYFDDVLARARARGIKRNFEDGSIEYINLA